MWTTDFLAALQQSACPAAICLGGHVSHTIWVSIYECWQPPYPAPLAQGQMHADTRPTRRLNFNGTSMALQVQRTWDLSHNHLFLSSREPNSLYIREQEYNSQKNRTDPSPPKLQPSEYFTVGGQAVIQGCNVGHAALGFFPFSTSKSFLKAAEKYRKGTSLGISARHLRTQRDRREKINQLSLSGQEELVPW